MATLSRSDLQFILQQIFIAEANAAGTPLTDLIANPFLSLGLRTVDGSFNNLVPGQQFFGAADQQFPRLVDPSFQTAEAVPPGFGPPGSTSYAQTSGLVFDSQPRTISNLIVDQTASNPAAYQTAFSAGADGIFSYAAQAGADGLFGTADDGLGADGVLGGGDDTDDVLNDGAHIVNGLRTDGTTFQTFKFDNVTPDVGLSAPFNSWFTLFGQFFDHGLDLVNKGGSGTIIIPLQPDDPLFVIGSPTNFMTLTRTTNNPGPDGILGNADDIHEAVNTTTPFVDQNQTYTSHASHQVFLREYALNAAGDAVSTGKLINGANGGIGNWAEVKAQAKAMLGLVLSDADVLNVPLLATDAYGNFIPGANGFARVAVTVTETVGSVVTKTNFFIEGTAAGLDLHNLPDPVGFVPRAGGTHTVSVIGTGHAFLNDIAHHAVPGTFDPDGPGPLAPIAQVADSDLGPEGLFGDDLNPATYDNELLDAHFITGDGRGNENIGLTTVHFIFHAEHNRQVDEIKATVLASGDPAFIAQWQISPGVWDGERLFQAARFATEMQYQHLVFEEFARKISPNIDAFLAPIGYDPTINPAIMAEFAHVVYRFGHSLLTETVDRYDPSFNIVDGDPNQAGDQQIGLIAAFLNPLAFTASGADDSMAAGAIIRGMTRQVGNEIDEFVTEALRNNLLGLPLDLPAINMTRGRDTGVPTLNEARAEFFNMTQDSQLAPYTSWVDFAGHLKHEASVINFIAAYGTHASITGAVTLAEKRAAATLLVLGGTGEPADRFDFLNSTGAYANLAGGATITGVNDIDLWVGGLAERQMPFGGLLGSTFNFVFETQLESLQNGDRFYYLQRTAGLNFAAALENNSFAKLIMLNTDATHLPAGVFTTPTWILEVDQARQFTGLGNGRDDPTGGTDLIPLVIRDNPQTAAVETNYLRYTGEDHIVLGGTNLADTIISSIGDDTIYGDGGNDRLEGGDGVDNINGGAGDDIITDLGGDDVIHGDAGNDVIQGGNGINILFGEAGKDFIVTGEDISTTFAGDGDDFVYGTLRNLETIGGTGNDWLERGHQEGTVGDTFDPTGQDLVAGHDVIVTASEFDDIITEGGDDIVFASDGQEKIDGASGFDWADYKFDPRGVSVDMVLQVANATPATPSSWSLLDLYAFVEGLSGSAHADVLRGDNVLASEFAFSGAQGSVLNAAGIARIAGMQALLGAGVNSFSSGNIILGGDGSDIIEGRRGDDLIDGDRWLNARISVRANADGTGAEIRSVDSMLDLVPDMLSGAINPGQLVIVREILTAPGPDFDTARYGGIFANYTINTGNDGTTTVTDNFGTLLGTEGTDTLRNIERLQFADVALQFDPVTHQFVIAQNAATNAGPSGLLQIRDAGLNAADNTPAVNQVLSVFAGNVTDADIAGGGASINGRPINYYWQVERAGVNGATGQYWEDIFTPAGLGGAPTAVTGPTFRVPTLINGLAATGLSLRVRAEYVDDHGVLENVFSAPTAAVAGIVAGPAPLPPVPAEDPTLSPGIHLIRSDLEFILDQIVIAERHAAGEDLLSLVGNERLPNGLRTVDGSFNNLVPGQTNFGAADQNFPLQLDQIFRNELDEAPFDTNGPGPGGVTSNTNYASTVNVIDTDPRIISNLIVDQTVTNPVAYQTAYSAGADGVFSYAAQAGADGLFGTADDGAGADGDPLTLADNTDDVLNDGARIINGFRVDGTPFQTFQFDNVTPDVGLTAPFNAWMTFFGQFFDHGLDLVDKGGAGTIFIPLMPDDPLFVAGSPTNFMVVTRATNSAVNAGIDGILGTSDDVHFHNNETTPFVDQNQTYTSHASHQVFLREYALNAAGHPVATGRLLDGSTDGGSGIDGGIGNWAEVKAQAATLLGIQLTDANIFDVPLLATDAYGRFIPGPNGFAQFVTTTGLVEANPAANGGLGTLVPVNALFSGHAFLNDIAHTAVPVIVGGVLQADADAITGNPVATNPQTGASLEYDDELLDAHFITGDGRGNENIGLTTVHFIFHAEHNRLVDHIKDVVNASNDPSFVAQWHLADGSWNGERLFQAARFATEMQYQHLVFEEFARTVQPQVDLFFAGGQVYDSMLNPAIVAEFAHVVYRFGHSMLTETVDRFDPDFNVVSATPGGSDQIGLIAAFLNPLAFVASDSVGPLNADEAAGAIVRGLTRTVGNEIDEFVTEALRNNLVGLPLDLPAINLARGRDTGVPTLNQARAEFYAMTGDAQLAPYTSWVDFAGHLKHEESVINFIAAYGTDPSITGAATTAAKRTAALALVTGVGFAGTEAQRLAFLNGPAATTGVDAVDLWIGGLAEEQMPFGGLLGSTFNFVFETQMEKLQDGDRFYYLERTAGLNFLTELEGNSFSKLIMANTDATHLPGVVFQTPTWILEVDATKQHNDLDGDGVLDGGDPVGGTVLTPLVIRDPATNFLKYTGEDHVVMGGTPGNDIIVSSIGDDTLYGDAGNDRLEGGDGVDMILGGAGDDILTDLGGDDIMQGGDGNDAIQGGNGINLVIGGFGSDFINSGEDASEIFGGPGNDFLLGSRANEQDMGNEGDDWIEHGNADGSPGDNFDPFGRDQVIGNDVYIGDTVVDIMNAEGGDDIMVGNGGQQDHYLGASGFDWADYKDSPNGVVVFADLLFEAEATALGANPSTLDRFFSVEGISGSQDSDFLIGSNRLTPAFAASGFTGSVLTNFRLIDGLRALVDPLVVSSPTGQLTFTGEILLGGDGSDYLKGGWGDEVIDGDAWLNVQIGVYDDLAHTHLLSRHDSMVEIQDAVFAGTINPGQLGIIREIRTTLLDGTPIGRDFDTAVFSDVRANYTVVTDNNGTANTADDVFTVTDVGTGLEGVDIVRNIERLQFADQALVVGGLNAGPVGSLTISDATPAEDQLLTVSIAGVTDGNNVSPLNPTGAITGAVTYYWQIEGTGGVFTDILRDNGITVSPVTGTSFRPSDPEVGFALRVRAVYKDANDVIEEVYSAATDLVTGVNDAPVGTVLISDTTPTEGQTLVAINAFSDADAVPLDAVGGGVAPNLIYNYQWQQSAVGGGAAFANIVGATDQSFTPGQGQVNRQLRVVVSYIDGQLFNNTVTSAPTTVTGDLIVTNGGDDDVTQNGNAGEDDLRGGRGNDTLNGNAGNDTLDGGQANDLLNGGAGNDLLAGGAGTDTLNGDAGDDTLRGEAGNDSLNGGAGNDLLEGGTGNDNINGGADTDTVSYASATSANGVAGVTVNLTITAAQNTVNAGNDTLSNLENIVGSAFNDTLTGSASANLIDGGTGNDSLVGLAGDDTLNGGAGNDSLTGGLGNDALDGGTGVDTAVYTGNFADYDLDLVNGVRTVTHARNNVATNNGTDTIRGIERLQFADQTVSIVANATPSGSPVVNDATPTEGQQLTASISLITDPDGLSAPGFTFQWQRSADGAIWTNIAGATTASYSPVQADVLQVLRVQVSFSDDGGTLETLTSAATGNVGDLINGAVGGTTLTGTAFSDTINGGAGADTLDGLAGDDTLDGGAGADIVNGGDGNDILFGANGADTLNGGAGSDNLQGDQGNDTLDGGTGADTMDGGAGDDVFVVDDFGDVVREAPGQGTDTVQATADYALSPDADIEILTFTGAGDFIGSGNGQANVITGGAGADTLNGLDGNDTLNGLDGNDRLDGDAGADTLNGGAGADTLIGNAGTDTLNGGADADTLNGGAGADTLNGGADADILIGGGGADTINTGAANDNLRDVILFDTANDFGDSVNNFDANGTPASATNDRVAFDDALNTLFDDGTSDDVFTFVSGNGANGGNTAANLNGTVEALFLSGANNEGVTNVNLDNAAAVATEFNAEFAMNAANGEATLLVINDTNGNDAAVWQYLENAGAEIQAAELTLIAIINANATVNTGDFALV